MPIPGRRARQCLFGKLNKGRPRVVLRPLPPLGQGVPLRVRFPLRAEVFRREGRRHGHGLRSRLAGRDRRRAAGKKPVRLRPRPTVMPAALYPHAIRQRA